MRWFCLTALLAFPWAAFADDPPTAQALIARHAREKSPVWADGDRATFFYRGDAEQVPLLLGGDVKHLTRLPDSDVWTVTVELPGLERGVFTYALLPGKKDQPPFKPGEKIQPHAWRGPKAPPAPAVAKDLKGAEKTFDVKSEALGETRKVRVYLPPGHDRSKAAPVIYTADGVLNADILEPLITAGEVPPVVVVGVASGGYRGGRDPREPHDVKKDLRAQEYLPGIDQERFGKHEKFFGEEVRAWAEKELGVSTERKDRAVFGCSNGARFAVEMGVRHPEWYAHVFAFSVAGTRQFDPPPAAATPAHFHLAAGQWEKGFHTITTNVAEKLRQQGVPVEFHARVSGHDDAMWRDEFVAAVRQAFAKK